MSSENGGQPKRTFREFQFIVVPLILVEEDGRVPFTLQGPEEVLRGLDELQAFIDRFPANLQALNAAGSQAE